MTDLKVAALADEFSRRGLTRRQILTLGARLGLTSATWAPCSHARDMGRWRPANLSHFRESDPKPGIDL